MRPVLTTLIMVILPSVIFASEVHELYSDTAEWRNFITKVESGDKGAIIKAIELQKNADAGAASELNDALFAALMHEPTLIIASYKQACQGRTDPLSTYENAIKEIDLAIVNVSKIATEAAKECVHNLKSSKLHVKRFFEVETNGL